MATLRYLKLHGNMVPCNYSKAVRLLRKAHTMDIPLAKELLSSCCMNGIGRDRDLVKAFRLLREVSDW